MKKLAIFIIDIYRNYISIIGIRCCRFHPSCSEYAKEAINRHGVIVGLFISLKRLLRCSPLSKGGYDPIR